MGHGGVETLEPLGCAGNIGTLGDFLQHFAARIRPRGPTQNRYPQKNRIESHGALAIS